MKSGILRAFKYIATGCIVLLSTLGNVPAQANDPAELVNVPANQEKKVLIIPVKDQISGRYEVFFRRVIREANEMDVPLMIIDMKTPGGSVKATMEIFDIIESFNGDTITFVNDEAYSAGALIAAATGRIYMQPDAVMGAATAIMVGPGGAPVELPESVDAKFSSALRAKMRSKASKNGHRPEVFEAMIDRKLKLEIDGEVLCEEGEILTLTGEEAFRSYGDPPKPLVAAGLVEDMDELLATLGYADAERIEAKETGAESLGYWLDIASPILLVIAVAGLYMEFKSPGFGVPGLIGIVAAGLYFLGGYVAGFSALAWMIVFFVGVALIFGEVLLFPGTFVLGVTGAVLMAVSITMAFLDYDPNRTIEPQPVPAQKQTEPQVIPDSPAPTEESPYSAPDPGFSSMSEYLKNAVLNRFRELGLVMLAIIVTLGVLAKVLPHTPYYNRIVSTSVSGVESVAQDQIKSDSLIGKKGRALTDLKPGGRARFDSQTMDVISDDGIIPVDTPIEIVSFSSSTPRVIKSPQVS